ELCGLVLLFFMSRRTASYVPCVSWRTRFAPSEMNATFEPSALIAGFAPQPKPTLPEYARLTSDIVWVFRSSSYTLLSSGPSMSLAIPQPHEPKARYRPVADRTGRKLSEAPPPVSIGSPSVMWPVARCETKMSQHRPVASTCCGTRCAASELTATTFPSAEIDGSMLSRFAPTPLGCWLTRTVRPVDIVCTKTSMCPSVSFDTRFVESEREPITLAYAESE